MAKVDYVKINNTINYIQNVAYLSELPVANENSADFVSVNNELYVKQVNGATYTYAKVGGSGGGLTVLNKTLDGELEIGATNLRFTEDFSLADFDLLYNFQAIIKFDIDNGNGVSSLYLVPTQSAKVGENSNVACFLSYANVMNIAVNLTLSDGALTYQIAITPIESGGSEPTIINLNTYVPSTATNGTLDSREIILLQESDQNYIVFNNEIFKLADKQHNEGYLVYSHNGHDTTGCFFQKCITITLSTRGWVLESQENQPKLTAGSGITIENNVISSSAGSGTTSDTAYVSNSTLYIEEGTTAGGGAGGLKILDAKWGISALEVQDMIDNNYNLELLPVINPYYFLGTMPKMFILQLPIYQTSNLVSDPVNSHFIGLTEDEKNKMFNGYYDKIILTLAFELEENNYTDMVYVQLNKKDLAINSALAEKQSSACYSCEWIFTAAPDGDFYALYSIILASNGLNITKKYIAAHIEQ